MQSQEDRVIEAEGVFNEISDSKFDIELLGSKLEKFNELELSLNKDIDDLKLQLEELEKSKTIIQKRKDESQEIIATRIKEINKKFNMMTTSSSPYVDKDDDDNDDLEDAIPIKSYLTVATAKKIKPARNQVETRQLYITQDVAIECILTNKIDTIPPGHLFYIPSESQFAMKFVIGNEEIVLQGNIGEIFIRNQDVAHTVELCRRSQNNERCLREECTFRHLPRKRGEIRGWLSAPTYMRSNTRLYSNTPKGTHKIGSRKYLKQDLVEISKPASNVAFNAYIEQTFHNLLVAFTMYHGKILDEPIKKYPRYMNMY